MGKEYWEKYINGQTDKSEVNINNFKSEKAITSLVPAIINPRTESQNSEVIVSSSKAVEKAEGEKFAKLIKFMAEKMAELQKQYDDQQQEINELQDKVDEIGFESEIVGTEAPDIETKPKAESDEEDLAQIGFPTLYMNWD